MLLLRPLTPEAFAPWGTVLQAEAGRRIAYPAATAAGDGPGRLGLSTGLHQPAPLPGRLVRLERHPHSAQSFLPLRVSRWMVAVAPTGPEGLFDLSGLAAFLAGPGDAIIINRNVWHAPMTVFDQPAEMAMLMWHAGAGDDTVLADLPEPVPFALP